VSCKVVRRKKRKVAVGDLRDRITLQNRDIAPPLFGDDEYSEDFEASAEVWAAVNTVAGKTVFNGVGTDVAITHEVFIRHDSRVTSETWIELADGRRLDIELPENWEERDEFMRLLCVDRGSKDKEASGS
jgi:SPP1 family predicted phage head-tail adaptor